MTRRQAIGFTAFCLLGGSRWIADSAYPSPLPEWEQAGLHYVFIGAVAAVNMVMQRRSPRLEKKLWLQLGAAGLLLLGFPALLGTAAHGVTSATSVGLFALVPLFVVVGCAALGTGGRVLMMPALVGLSGVLLLLPFQLPATLSGSFSFGLVTIAVLLTAAASIWLHSLLQRSGAIPAISAICAANAVVAGLVAWSQGSIDTAPVDVLVEIARCALLDLPLLFLLVWLLKEITPSRLAARFLLIPLLSTIEATIGLHDPLNGRLAVGAVLTVLGSAALMLWKEADYLDEGRLRLR